MTTTSRRPRVGYLVDVQNDFMRTAPPGGRLYVRHLQDPEDVGAEQIIPALERLARWMYKRCDAVILSGDWHGPEDAEVDPIAPDFRTTYPPHCLRGTRGARKLPETEQEDPVPVTLETLPERFLQGREFLLMKKSFDVFTNPNTDRLLDVLDPDAVVVFGVATDVCDDAAIKGFLERGLRVQFVEDAARGLDEGRVASCTAAWREQGVEFTTAAEVVASLTN